MALVSCVAFWIVIFGNFRILSSVGKTNLCFYSIFDIFWSDHRYIVSFIHNSLFIYMTNLDFGMVLDYSIENLRFGLRKTIEIFEYSEFLLHYMQCNLFWFHKLFVYYLLQISLFSLITMITSQNYILIWMFFEMFK